jgi:hypothetical protein
MFDCISDASRLESFLPVRCSQNSSTSLARDVFLMADRVDSIAMLGLVYRPYYCACSVILNGGICPRTRIGDEPQAERQACGYRS